MPLRLTSVLALLLVSLPTSAQLELAAPVPPSRRLPEPAAAVQQETAKRIRELYKEDFARRTPADLQALAQKLLKDGRATTDDPDARYVLLREAKDLAAQAGDTPAALAAADVLAKLYAVDAAALKASTLATLERAVRTPEAAAALAEARLALAAEALVEDLPDAAAAHAAKAETAARAAQDPALLARAQARAKEAADAKRDLPAARAAEKTLEQKPDDPAACLTAGRWCCLAKGDWEKGLPLLAKGSDAGLKTAAGKDLEKPSTAPDQVAAGDAWWDLAEKAPAAARAPLAARALFWYATAWPHLSALNKTRLRDRARAALASRGAAADPKAYKPPAEAPAGWEIPENRRNAHLDERFARTGRNALFLSAPEDDSIRATSTVSVPAAAGQRFVFSAWVRTEGTSHEKEYLQLRYIASDNDGIDSDTISPPADTPFWSHLTRTGTCPKGTVRVTLSFRAGPPGGQIWIDDVSLKREGEGIELIENGSFERREVPR
jgi:hypothetical protein